MTILCSSRARALVSGRDERRQLGGMLQRLVTTSRAAVLFLLMQVSLACDLQGLPPLVDDHRSRDPSEELVNILVPSYQFSCHGRVTNWAACVDPGGDRERYDIRFQVWRPSVDGCFTLVGVNVPSQLLAPVDHCVEYQVPRDDQIEVLPDDIIGFYVDRYKLSRREDELEDPANGGIQLDTEWSASVRLLSSGQLVGVGVRQCSLTQLDNNGAAPVLSASVVTLPPPTTSPLPVGPQETPKPPSTSLTPSHTSLTPSLTPSHTSLAPSHTSLTPSLTSLTPSSPSPLVLDDTYSPSPSAPLVSQMGPSSSPLLEHSSHTLASSETIPSPTTSSVSLMTSSSTQPGVIPVDEGGLPPLLIGGIFMSAILIIAVTSLAVVLVTMLLWRPRSVKGKVDYEEGEMVYSEAYEANGSVSSSNSNSVPGQVLGLVWNRAYNKCTMLHDSPHTPEPEHGNWTGGAECRPGIDPEIKDNILEKEVIYDEVSDFSTRNKYSDGHTPISCKEYEEIY